jgi:hypothetical protein
MKENEIKDWTHKKISIKDIRKISGLYILLIEDETIKMPLFVNENIFNDRLRSYFLKDINKISREDILTVKWNMYISYGYFIKIKGDNIEQIQGEKDKYYISYLEINSPLATFSSINSKQK